MRRNGISLAACLVMLVLLTGCGNEQRLESQKKYREYGLRCLQEGKYEEAVEGFQSALDQSMGKVGSMELDLCYYKAEAQIKAERYEDAMETYQALLDYKPNPEVYYLRGCLYFIQGYGDKGREDFDTAVKMAPKSYALYIGIYKTLSKYDQEEDAKGYLEQALAIKGEKEADLLYKGQIQYLLGNLTEARGLLESALAKGSKDANLHLALVEETAGNSEKAAAYFDSYIKSGNATSEGLCQLGELRMKAGDYASAIAYFSSGLDLDDGSAKQKLLRNLIICYEYTGDFAAAREKMEEYMVSFPDDEEARKEQVFLNTR